MPRFYHPRDEHLMPAVTFLTPADTELFTSVINLGFKSLFVFLTLLKCLEFQRAVGKVQRAVFRDLGSAAEGLQKKRTCWPPPHCPPVPCSFQSPWIFSAQDQDSGGFSVSRATCKQTPEIPREDGEI